MTHDPLCPVAAGPCCPWMGDCACQCRCEEYAKVRQDERAKYSDASALWSDGCEHGVADAVEAVKASGNLDDREKREAVAAIEALGARIIDKADVREVSVNTDGSGTGHVLPDGYATTDTVTSPRGHGWPGWRQS